MAGVTLQTMGDGMRRVAIWALKSLAAVLTFVVVYRVTRFFTTWKLPISDEAGSVLGTAFFVWLVEVHIPLYMPRRRAALLARLAQLPRESPELAAAALRHFRRRSRVLVVPAAFLLLYAAYGLVSAFTSSSWHPLDKVVALLIVLLFGAMGLAKEHRRLRTLANAASSDEAKRWNVVRSCAREAGGTSADPVSRELWRWIGPPAPELPAVSSPEVSSSAA